MMILAKIKDIPRRVYRGIRRRRPLKTDNIDYHLDPWFTQTSRRVREIKKALKQNKKVAITIFHTADATFRYRCYNISKACKGSQEWASVYFFYNELNFAEYWLPKVNLFVIARMEYEPVVKRLIKIAHKHSIPVVYDIDDRICHNDYLPLALKTITPPPKDREAIIRMAGNYQKTAELVDGFITTNDLLGRELEETFKKPYQVIPNSLNYEQEIISKHFILDKHNLAEEYRIGYFSGSSSHDRDFQIVAPELLKFMNEYKDTKLWIVGKLNLPKGFKKIEKEKRIKYLPVTDYLHLQGLMSEVDVNLAPLVLNKFTDCKSELKFFESAIVETPTIASPTYTFKKAIKNGETGYLCQKGEWYNYLIKLRDRNLRKKIGKAARRYCLRHYSPEAILPQVESAYNYYLKGKK